MSQKINPPIAVYSALADASRCRIIEILLAGPLPVHELADAFAISRPAISRHLRVLKSAGIVAEVKKGRENLYTLKPSRLSRSVEWLERVATGKATSDQPVGDPVPSAQPLPATVASAKSGETVLTRADTGADAVKALPRARKMALVNQMGFDF